MSDTFDVTTIVFALLALFVLFKLRSVLGARTGNERPPHDPFARQRNDTPTKPAEAAGNVIRLPGASAPQRSREGAPEKRWEKIAEPKAWSALDEVTAIDPGFSGPTFVEGAKSAYEMIVSAFASGDRNTLQALLSPEVFDGFASAITAREARGEKIETTFVSLEKAVIDDAQVRGDTAQITVRVQSKLITATRDRTNAVIDGSPDKVVDITDVWTFSRDLRSRDPNWRLIATETVH